MRFCMGCMEQIGEEYDVCPHCGYVRGTPPKEAYHMPPESILAGRYIVGRVLGYGGFGVTYIGWDAQLERKVAIKEFLPAMFATRLPGDTTVTVYSGESTAQFQAGLERFTDEAQRLAKFNSVPGIVDIYDTCVQNNTAYIVMEFLQGQDVKDLLTANGPLPYDRAKEIVLSVCETLEPVHAQGIIHRDISPDNIYITQSGQIKLLDFGAARYETSRNSKSLSVVLKAGYAPEEQYRTHGNQGGWTDVYALAATMYKMITGETPVDSMERAVRDELRPPSALGAELPPSAENALMNALNVRAEERTRSVEAFRAQLTSEDVERVKVKARRSDSGKIPVWGRVVIGAAAALVLIFAALAATGTFSEGGGLLSDTFGSSVPEGYVNAPGVVNRSQDEAQLMLEDASLSYFVAGREYSDSVEKNRVLSQEPQAGRLIELGGTVNVTICGGPEGMLAQGETPDLVYLDVAAAQREMDDVQDVVVEKQFVYASNVASGLVIDQQEDVQPDGSKRLLLTISLGPLIPEGATMPGIPYMEARIENGAVCLYEVLAQPSEEALRIYYEFRRVGEEAWTMAPHWNLARYGWENFSELSSEDVQPLVFNDILMSMARNQSVPSGEPFEFRAYATNYTDEGWVPFVLEHPIRIHNDAATSPAVSVSGVEEVVWEEVDRENYEANYGAYAEDGVYLYRVKGDFKAGSTYFVYEGIARMGENRYVTAAREGELILASRERFDGSQVLARFLPLYGAGEDEDGTLWMHVGPTATVDGKDMVLTGELGDIRGRTVFDAVSEIAAAAGRYAARLPYRFSYVYSDDVPRGCVVDFYLEGASNTGEVYRLDIVVSNGPESVKKTGMIVPIVWSDEGGDESVYARLEYMSMPGNDPAGEIYHVLEEFSMDGGATWHCAVPDDADMGSRYHPYPMRGDGYSPDSFYSPDGFAYVTWQARIFEGQGKMTVGDPLRLRLTAYDRDGKQISGSEQPILDVVMKEDLPK